MKIRLIFLIYTACWALTVNGQNIRNIDTDIERAVREFFYKVSEMNAPVNPIYPTSIAPSYQRGINTFQVNGSNFSLKDFLVWYKKNVLEDLSVSHEVKVESIEKLSQNNRFIVKGVLKRRIEDDTKKRRIRDENLTMKVVWRGSGINNVSFQSISFNLKLSFLMPNVIKEYEFTVAPNVTHLSADGGEWQFNITSNVKSMEGFDDEERACIDVQPIGGTCYTPDNIKFNINGRSLSGIIDKNTSKNSRCFLIRITQNESNDILYHYIYQEGKDQK